MISLECATPASIRSPIRKNSILLWYICVFFAALIVSCQPIGEKTELASSTPMQPAQTYTQTKTITATPSATPTPTATPPEYLQITPEALSKITVEFWHPWSGIVARQIDTLIKEFNLNNEWGIIVSITTQGSAGELSNRVEASLEDQDGLPDIVVAPMDQILAWQTINPDAVVVLNNYSDSPMWGLSKAELADIPFQFLKQSTNGEDLLSLPAQRSAEVLFYNQSWAAEMGFDDPPENPVEFMEQACAAAQTLDEDETRENDGLGGWIINTDPNVLLSWLYAFGAEDLPEKETQTYLFNTPVGRETFSYLRALYDDGCAWVSRDATSYEYFANRQALFYSGTLQDLPLQERTNSRLQVYDQWTILPYPAQEVKPIVLISGPSYVILRSTPEEQLASWLFIRWLNQPLNQTRMVQVSNTLALGAASTQMMDVYAGHHPQWKESLFWMPMGRSTPQQANWRVVRNILGDAGWQTFQTYITAEDIPAILTQLDEMIIEVLRHLE